MAAYVHSKTKGDEKDEVVQQLLTVEDPENPVEIVVHVNMLKEGWDVTNLYTIIPLRKADSRTLVEQSIGRGLRLPYGKRTGNDAVDRLTIVAHDKFQEIVDEANRGDSILVTGIVIGKDIPEKKSKAVEVQPKVVEAIVGSAGGGQETLFPTQKAQAVAKATLDVIRDFEHKPRSSDLTSTEVQQEIVEKVTAALGPYQIGLEGLEEPEPDIAMVVAEATSAYVAMSIDVPRITVVPTGEVTSGFGDFDLDTRNVRFQPVAQDILIQTLKDNNQYRLRSMSADPEDRLENYLVRGLIDFDDVSYDEHAELLYKISGQMVSHLRSYLPDDDAVLNVLQAHNQPLVKLIHAQMEDHFHQDATSYEVSVSKGFTTLSPTTFLAPEDEEPRPFRVPVDEKRDIRKMLFGGFEKCLYPVQKFDSDTERRFAVVLENDADVEKWVKPGKNAFRIHYSAESEYEPDFVAETPTTRYLCEPKAENDMEDDTVLAKARAASEWCRNATTVSDKPWKYLLIPHTAIDESKTLEGLAGAYNFESE